MASWCHCPELSSKPISFHPSPSPHSWKAYPTSLTCPSFLPVNPSIGLHRPLVPSWVLIYQPLSWMLFKVTSPTLGVQMTGQTMSHLWKERKSRILSAWPRLISTWVSWLPRLPSLLTGNHRTQGRGSLADTRPTLTLGQGPEFTIWE